MMSTTTDHAGTVETTSTAIDLLDRSESAPAKRGCAAVRRLERGLTTAEYAVGILGAMAAGLLLFRLFNDNAVFDLLFQMISKILNHVTSLI